MRGIVPTLACIGCCMLFRQLSASHPSMVDMQFVSQLEATLGGEGKNLMSHIMRRVHQYVPGIRTALSVDPFTLTSGVAAALKTVRSDTGYDPMVYNDIYRDSISRLEVSNSLDNVSFSPYPMNLTKTQKKLLTVLSYNYFVSQYARNPDCLLNFFPTLKDVEWDNINYADCATAADVVSQYIRHITHLQQNAARYPTGNNIRKKFLENNLYLLNIGIDDPRKYNVMFTHPDESTIFTYLSMALIDYPIYKDHFENLTAQRLSHFGKLCVDKNIQTPSAAFKLIMDDIIHVVNLNFTTLDKTILIEIKALYEAQQENIPSSSNFPASNTSNYMPTSQSPYAANANSIPTKRQLDGVEDNFPNDLSVAETVNRPNLNHIVSSSSSTSVSSPPFTPSQSSGPVVNQIYPELPSYASLTHSYSQSILNLAPQSFDGPPRNADGIPLVDPPAYSEQDERNRAKHVDDISPQNGGNNLNHTDTTATSNAPNEQANVTNNFSSQSSTNYNAPIGCTTFNSDGGVRLSLPGVTINVPSTRIGTGAADMNGTSSTAGRFHRNVPPSNASTNMNSTYRMPSPDESAINDMLATANTALHEAIDRSTSTNQFSSSYRGPSYLSASSCSSSSSSSSRSSGVSRINSHNRSSQENSYRTSYNGLKHRNIHTPATFGDTILIAIFVLAAIIFFSACGSVHGLLQREKKAKISKANLRSTADSGRSANSNSMYFQLLVA